MTIPSIVSCFCVILASIDLFADGGIAIDRRQVGADHFLLCEVPHIEAFQQV
jgi:hypothetical protein